MQKHQSDDIINMIMKFNKKNVFLAGLAALLISLGFYWGLHRQASPEIAFYNIDDKVQKAIIETLEANLDQKFSTITLDSNKSLNEQKKSFKKSTLLIFTNSLECINTLEGKGSKKALARQLDRTFTEGFPSSVLNSLNNQKSKISDDTILFLPFLFDFYQIDVNLPLYQQSQMEAVEVWDHLAEACYREIPFTKNPFVLPLGDDASLLTTFGIFAEALSSYQLYDQMLEEFENAQTDDTIETILKKYSEKDSCLDSVINELSSMIRSGIIPKASLKMNSENVTFLMDNDLCGMSLLKLSEHRQLSKDTSKHVSCIYCPSKNFTPERKFATEQISLALLQENTFGKKLVKALVADFQGDLATKSGLAPVQKNCTVPDHQADDVRFWLAASKGPVMPFAQIFKSDQERKIAADYLRNLINSEIE